jgi:nucleoside-diphosphate-sugar epimerase
MENQGQAAWFDIAATLGMPVTIYGDGEEVRDVLHVSDLCRASKSKFHNSDRISGEAFNIGGGAANTLSLLDPYACLKMAGTGRSILHGAPRGPAINLCFPAISRKPNAFLAGRRTCAPRRVSGASRRGFVRTEACSPPARACRSKAANHTGGDLGKHLSSVPASCGN